MDKPFLPKKLSLSDAITELKLDGDNFSHSRAVNYLLKYAQFDGLKIHFRADITGYDINKSITRTKEYVDDTNDLMIDEDVSYFDYLNDELIFKYGSCQPGQEQAYLISVFRFQCEDVEYYSVDETEQFVVSRNFKEDDFYIFRDDLKNFINHMENRSSSENQNIDAEGPYTSNADYLDPNNKNYSKELHTSIEAWLFANNANESKYGDSFKKRIEEYLKSDQIKLNSTAAKRVAIVANSNENKRNKEK